MWRKRRWKDRTKAVGSIKITRRITVQLVITTLIFFLMGLALALFIIIDQRLKPTMLQIAEARALQIATQAANRAVNEKIAQSIRYEDLVHIIQDNTGRPVFVQHNTGEINRLLSEVALEVQNALILTDRIPIKVPLGQIFGSQLLSSWGPEIPVNMRPMGTVETDVLDRVESVGINVSRYRTYAALSVRVRVVVPLMSGDVKVSTQVVMTDFLVVGEVPQFYMGGSPGKLEIPQEYKDE